MTIPLTEQQQQELDAHAESRPRFIDPGSNAAYYLVDAADYDTVRELLEEERRQRTIRAISLRNAAGRMESEP